MNIENICIIIVILPLLSSFISGFFGNKIGKTATHNIAIISVGLAFFLSLILIKKFVFDGVPSVNFTLYEWMKINNTLSFEIGFLIDKLTILMISTVCFVSWMVHIYTVGYMETDPGYQRFFCYISAFTFAMLMLVMSNNFLQLFFGWEGVGLVSYLLIGFWHHKETAIFANLKAFLVNRVGDFGFLLGIAGILFYFNTLDFISVFNKIEDFMYANHKVFIISDIEVEAINFICIGLFIGAMGKSAQVPLHVWLPDSMEGPTPISALIHAATMVTAGVFMVSRMSPLFENSDVALNFILIIGSTTCFFMGLLGIVSNDIKKIIAYSTLSQLGYMVCALGASAYAFSMFHLMTHAFFKALLLLGAGSVIIAMHHEQDINKMGNLKKYMPITYITMLLGSLALIGFPFFSGFFSKDLVISAVGASNLPFSNIAYIMVLSSVFVTSLYSFRLLFRVFHTTERMDEKTKSHLHECKPVVTVPLILLAIPSVLIGYITVSPIMNDYFGDAIFVNDKHIAMNVVKDHFHGTTSFALHGFTSMPFFLAISGIFVSWLCFIKKPKLADDCKQLFLPIYKILEKKYAFDEVYQFVFVGGAKKLGNYLWSIGDRTIIDNFFVNGSYKSIDALSKIMRKMQTGYLYNYAFTMITGFLVLLVWLIIH
jgi:NADH-quinone oxidoreductase subunit L